MKKIILVILFIAISQVVQARTFLGEGIYKKQKEKESMRWTLSGWLQQKQKFFEMDQILAMGRTLGFFEINIEGSESSYDFNASGSVVDKDITRYSASVYWSIFGVQYMHEDSTEDWTRESTQLNIRLIGTSSQSTNLVAFAGVRKWEYENPVNEIEQNYAGGKLSLYIFSFFGIDGEYKKFNKAEDTALTSYDSERVEYGVFLDFNFVRVYASQYKEEDNKTTNLGVKSVDTREGTEAGVKFYF